MNELNPKAAAAPPDAWREPIHAPHAAETADGAPLPLSARQGLMWVDDQLFPDARYHNLPVVLELRGPLDVERLTRAWSELVATHDALRLSIDRSSPVQSYVSGEAPPLARVRVAAGEVD